MSYIIKEKDGNIRDLTKNPHGAGYCNNCQNWLNYGCLKNQNPSLCMIKEPAVFEQNETRLTYPKMRAPQIPDTLPTIRSENLLKGVVAHIENLAETNPKAYNVFVNSIQWQLLLEDLKFRIKEMGLSNVI